MTALGCGSSGLLGDTEELVEGRIANPGLLAAVAGIAARFRRDTALGFRAADEGHAGQGAGPFVAFGAQQQPLDRAWSRRVCLGRDLAHDGGAMASLPGRP